MRILVTGGAGYIGSHTVLLLAEAGHDVVVYDNLSTGNEWALLGQPLIHAELSDHERLRRELKAGGFDAVLHFAAHIVVPESVADPLKYYRNNTLNTLGLIQACIEFAVPKFIFSSTAAVYGEPAVERISEKAPLNPINPYGASKMMSERILMDAAQAHGLNYVILRYFNVAGADPEARIGQATPDATHLIKVASEAAVGKRPGMKVFGQDYPTPDGTCVRDYIHVMDLASAHVEALNYLQAGGASDVFNCGYGRGASVFEVIQSVKEVTGIDFPVEIEGRRAGDPAQLVADNGKLLSTMPGWKPQFDSLAVITHHAYRWEQKLGEMRHGLQA
jgi:UDP-glucose 4-epimerase